MDAPIYIHFSFIDERYLELPGKHQNTYLHSESVVCDRGAESRDGETSAAGEQLINSGNEKTRVTVLNLPDLGHYSGSSVAVAKSRLFIVGGYDSNGSEGVKFNGIRSFNLAHKDDTPSWETSPLADPPEAFGYVGGTAVSDDGNLIYGLGLRGNKPNIFAFDPEGTFKFDSFVVPAPVTSRPRLLALTDTKLYVNCASNYGGNGLLGYCDIKSLTWHTLDPNASLFSLRTRVVVVRDCYLISFALEHPVTEEFCPALYVYDIRRRIWLPEPVQGLPNDGIILPSFKSHVLDGLPIYQPSLMQVRRDELKLALVWCISDEVHIP